jgi:hypothetical protein
MVRRLQFLLCSSYVYGLVRHRVMLLHMPFAFSLLLNLEMKTAHCFLSYIFPLDKLQGKALDILLYIYVFMWLLCLGLYGGVFTGIHEEGMDPSIKLVLIIVHVILFAL